MQTLALLKEKFNETLLADLLHAALGSAFLALTAQFSVYLPGTPVPFTLQTLGLFMLIIVQGKRRATFAAIAYLAQACCGLPVLAGGTVNPLWFAFPKAGYLIGMAAGAYIGGAVLETGKKRTLLKTALAIFSAQLCIYVFGVFWLSTFLGVKQAVAAGIFPFIPGAAMKMAAAVFSDRAILSVRNRLAA